ncbi:MAG: Ferrichrome receptor FcuA [Steroidobacteraceae bacterium]|nr:Ferrichrome receptor FcuA [Steroidobacteraceae bacterium]
MSMRRNVVLTAACALALGSALATAQQASESTKLEEVIVYGSQVTLPPEYAGGQVATGGRAGILGNMDTLETPFSSTNYTAELMLNQQAKSIADVLLNDPNVRVARGFGNFQELYVMRGFPAYSDDMTYNGIYGILPRQFVAAELLERAEVFRGANAFLNGAAPGGSNLGGTINLVPKRAPNEPLTRLTAGYESDASGLLALDIGRRFGADLATGIRANAVYRNGETSVQDQDRELSVLSFGIDRRGEKLRLSADVGFQDHHIDAPRPSVLPAFGATGVPREPDADVNFAQPWTYTDERQLFGVVRAEYDVTHAVSLWGAFGMRDGDEKNVLANPSAAADGTMSGYRFDNAREDSVYSGEVGLRWDVATGPVEHRIIASGSVFSIDSKNAYAFSNFFAPFITDLYHPVDAVMPPANFFTGGSLSSPHKTFANDTSSFALADMLKFADGKFILTVGARNQTLKADTFDYNTGNKTSSYDKSKVTPVGGVVFRPTKSLSFFANYIEGLVAGDVAPVLGPNGETITNAGQAQDPYAAEQIEAGVKFDAGSFGAGLSVFNIEKAIGILEPVDDPATPGNDLSFRADGQQRHRGVEANVYGQPRDNLRLIGGVTWLEAEMTKTQGGFNQGKDVIGAPKMQANFNVEWDLPVTGLTLDARAMYTSKQYADAANTLEVDSWTRFDVGARYATELAGKPFSVRARINNVTNESSWISAGGYPGFGYYVLGDPRTFVLSASFDF